MVPDTRLRLATLAKALADIIAPALPADAGFARDQLALITKSLAIVIGQIGHEHAFTVRDAMDYHRLAADLAARLPDVPARRALEHVCAASRGIVPEAIPDRAELEAHVRDLRGAIEAAMADVVAENDPALRHELSMLVLDHSTRQTLRERAWAIDTGFESDPSAVPPVETLIYGDGAGRTNSD